MLRDRLWVSVVGVAAGLALIYFDARRGHPKVKKRLREAETVG